MAMLPDDVRQAMQAQEQDTSFSVLPENVEAVRIFCAVSTQWRWIESQRIGLMYNELLAVIQLYNVNDPIDCFERVQIMEAEVLLAK